MRTVNAGWAVRALIGSLAVLLPAGAWAAVTVDREAATTVLAGGRAGATSVGDAALLDEPPPMTAPVTVAPMATSTTAAPATSTTKAPATSTTKPPTKPAVPRTTTTTADLPAFMKTNPNPPGFLPAASSWEAKGDGVTVRMRIELLFGDDSPHFFANNNPLCAKGGSLSPGTHSSVVTHTYDAPAPYRTQVRILDGDLCTLPPNPAPGAPLLIGHLEMFACIAVGPDTPMTPGCDPLPTYGPYSPQ